MRDKRDNPFDRGLHKKVARGRQPIHARLDLHGCTQAEAHDRLHSFIRRSSGEGLRVVIVVTGKGRGEEGGVLRRVVPMWLSSPPLSGLIVGYNEAARGHGGEGALYIHLRNRFRPDRD